MSCLGFDLPVDISWKRICVSEDMIDRFGCDHRFPSKWKTSTAIFHYQPPEEYQTDENQIISYIKVTCSLTGFQPEGEEVGINSPWFGMSTWESKAVTENYEQTVDSYYPCLGALLQVSITPKIDPKLLKGLPSDQFPIIMDFQPKKRELYELVSETGEQVSRTLDSVNIRKGNTTTDTNEILDIFTGFGANFTYEGNGGGLNFSGQYGSRDIHQEERSNIRTTDNAREKRETYAHSTQLTQMYHQLNSYHLGTNRALFYLLPRPHIVETPKTFVNGPRSMEGIQEFILVVAHPKNSPGFCVDTWLETAHLGYVEVESAGLKRDVETWGYENLGKAVKKNDDHKERVSLTETYYPPEGYEIDLSMGEGAHGASGGFDLLSETTKGLKGVNYTVTKDKIEIWSEVEWFFDWGTFSDDYHDGLYKANLKIYLIEKSSISLASKLFLTGRALCCCSDLTQAPKETPRPSVNFEVDLDTPFFNNPFVAGMSIIEANKLGKTIGYQMIRSVNSSKRRPIGAVSFGESDFVSNQLTSLLTTEANWKLADFKIPESIVSVFAKNKVTEVRRANLLTWSNNALSKMGFDEEQVRFLKQLAVGTSELIAQRKKG